VTGTLPGLSTVRYYCLVTLGEGPFLGYDVLQALARGGFDVRACPIGAAFLAYPPWLEVMHLFTAGPPSPPFINMVCAPLCYLLGQPTTGVDFAGLKGDPTIVYQPQTALMGLYTVGVPNVAVTLPRAPTGPATEGAVSSEIQALEKYDLVIAPTEEDAQGLRDLGVSAISVPPDPARFVEILSPLLLS
jgi:hypothetical protein